MSDRPACLYCHRAFPPNDVVELFPFGRRVAVDATRNRYWVVCGRCRKWSLVPLLAPERALVIEQFERWWTRANTRFTRDGIGIGRYSDRLSVVRVGNGDWSEFAAWRHADALRARRMWRLGAQMSIVVGAASLMAAGVVGGSVAFGAIAGTVAGPMFTRRPHLSGRKAICRVTHSDGTRPALRRAHLRNLELVPTGRVEWGLNVQHQSGTCRLQGIAGIGVLSYALPTINRYGGTTAAIREGIAIIREAGGPEAVLSSAAARQWPRVRSDDHYLVAGLPPAVRMALEMAVHEHREQAALDGELALLRQDWADAEELAVSS